MIETLRRFQRRPIALEEAIRVTLEALGNGVTLIGLCAAPTTWQFARLSLVNRAVNAEPAHGALDLPATFDLRAFAPGREPGREFELRWRRAGAEGVAAWVTTDAGFDPARLGADKLGAVATVCRIPSSRLLFGTRAAAGPRQGWITLAENRIGSIAVPFDGPPSRLRLIGVELVAREPVFGNAHVAEEILTGLAHLGEEPSCQSARAS
jgi:CRISPR-associated protein (TIGR03984 family)